MLVSESPTFQFLGSTLLSLGDFKHYALKEISVDHRALTTFVGGFRILETCKTYYNHISIWTWQNTSLHTLVKIILDHGSQTLLYPFPFFFSKTHKNTYGVPLRIPFLVTTFSDRYLTKDRFSHWKFKKIYFETQLSNIFQLGFRNYPPLLQKFMIKT